MKLTEELVMYIISWGKSMNTRLVHTANMLNLLIWLVQEQLQCSRK